MWDFNKQKLLAYKVELHVYVTNTHLYTSIYYSAYFH